MQGISGNHPDFLTKLSVGIQTIRSYKQTLSGSRSTLRAPALETARTYWQTKGREYTFGMQCHRHSYQADLRLRPYDRFDSVLNDVILKVFPPRREADAVSMISREGARSSPCQNSHDMRYII
eukprot:3504645-Pyramimonas_sp.AAC.2